MSFAEDTTFTALFCMLSWGHSELTVPDMYRASTGSCPGKWHSGDWFLCHEYVPLQAAMSVQELVFRSCRTCPPTCTLLRLVYVTEVGT
jgi:hypothetical protein